MFSRVARTPPRRRSLAMLDLPGIWLVAVSLVVIPTAASAVQNPARDPAGNPARPAVDLDVSYVADLSANVSGGRERGIVGLGNLDARLRVDGEALLGWEGTSFFLYGLGNHGGRVTELTGDAQVASNIQAPTSARVYEAWIQQNFEGPNLSVLLGLYDVNSEFDVLRDAGVFLNSSFGIGAEFASSGPNGPSIFPVTSLGVRAQWHPTHWWYVQGAVLDGVPGDPGDPGATAIRLSPDDGILWVAEWGYLHHSSRADVTGEPELGRDHIHPFLSWRVAVGAWGYSRRGREIGTGRRVESHPGVYFMTELYPYRESDGVQELSAFARVGAADDRTDRFGAYTGVGLTYTGLLPGRDRDVAGLGVATAWNGSAWEESLRRRGIPVTDAETTLELTYRAGLTSWLAVQPDVQWVVNPNADPRISDALLLTTRVELGF